MSATTISAPVPAGQSSINGLRLVLVTLAIVVLFAASFVIGRVTASTTSHTAPASTPVAPAAPASGATPTTTACRMGRPC